MRGEGCGVRGEGCKGEREKGHSSVTEPIEAACIVRGSEDCVRTNIRNISCTVGITSFFWFIDCSPYLN